jgi:hypothetical protein
MILRLLEVAAAAWAETVRDVGAAFATGKDNRQKSSNDGYDKYNSGFRYDASNNYGYDHNARLNPDVVEARKRKP